MSNPTPDRRAPDPRIDVLVHQMAEVQRELTANTEITKQVADVLASFRVVAKVSKWTAAVIAGIIAVWHGIKEVSS